MRLSKEEIVTIKKYLFKESVCLVRDKDDGLHPELKIPNKQVMKFLKSCQSKNMVYKVFVWQHAYWFLNENGVEVLRDELCLPSTEVPKTYANEVYEPKHIREEIKE